MPTTKYEVRTYTARGAKVETVCGTPDDARDAAARFARSGRRAVIVAVRVPDRAVRVTECSHCTLTIYGYEAESGECPRCGSPESHRHERWIADPHPDTTAKATAKATRNAAE